MAVTAFQWPKIPCRLHRHRLSILIALPMKPQTFWLHGATIPCTYWAVQDLQQQQQTTGLSIKQWKFITEHESNAHTYSKQNTTILINHSSVTSLTTISGCLLLHSMVWCVYILHTLWAVVLNLTGIYILCAVLSFKREQIYKYVCF